MIVKTINLQVISVYESILVHNINHITFSPDSTKISYFRTILKKGNQRQICFYYYCLNKRKNVIIDISKVNLISHYCWKNKNEIMFTMKMNNKNMMMITKMKTMVTMMMMMIVMVWCCTLATHLMTMLRRALSVTATMESMSWAWTVVMRKASQRSS